MDKKTILAIGLSAAVIVVFYLVQGLIFPRQDQAAAAPPQPAAQEGALPEAAAPGAAPVAAAPSDGGAEDGAGGGAGALPAAAAVPDAPLVEERVALETPLVSAVLSSRGGDIVSFRLKEHTEESGFVEMVLPVNGRESHAFTLGFGGPESAPAENLFRVSTRPSAEHPYDIAFTGTFTLANGQAFDLTKKYEFKPDEYLFKLTVSLNAGNTSQAFDFGGAAYTIGYGPQMGPAFQKLDQRYEYRRYNTYINGKLKTEKVSDRELFTTKNSGAKWAAIAGKYFTVAAIPMLAQYDLSFDARPTAGLAASSRLLLTRPAVNASRQDDSYYFYLGPKTQDTMNRYNNGKNGFGLTDQDLAKIANSGGFLAPLEWLLKILLQAFHFVVRNYGVAIILLTILVKVLMFPLTRKQSESTLKMQALAPKIKELQTKYKDNPQKMNAEMAAFYKKEGYNPLSGCLPMLIQIPIFFAMYNLFNNHFDLRGALFIPHWIPDLSRPETIYHFENFSVPLLGWTDLRLLPFIYVGSQLIYGRVTQTPDQKGGTQMKLMMYVLPIVFFFILYDVPSGLLIYWIMSNVLTLVQQMIINKYMAKRKAAEPAAEPSGRGPVIAPRKKKRR
ncbi:MAG: membrane protein insertase YidC [Treponema sp.]|jgi:YidC/Oxa1 family membrane protein insertase|nr:membrane protein insertase YidC [Treponema sp.]